MTMLAPKPLPAAPQGRPTAESVLAAELARGSIHRARLYRRAWRRFTAWLGIESPARVLERLALQTPAAAVADIEAYAAMRLAAGRRPMTVNAELAAIRAVTAAAVRAGVMGSVLPIRTCPTGPMVIATAPMATEQVQALLAKLDDDAKGRRDRVIVLLAYVLGLGPMELAAIDVGDVDLAAGTMTLRRVRHRAGSMVVSVPSNVAAAISAWLEVRPDDRGSALLMGLDPAAQTNRLGQPGVFRIVRSAGKAAGLKVSPRRLRRTGAHAVGRASGNAYQVQGWGRWRSLKSAALVIDAVTAGDAAMALDRAVG